MVPGPLLAERVELGRREMDGGARAQGPWEVFMCKHAVTLEDIDNLVVEVVVGGART